MLELRRVQTDEDVDVFLALREAIDPGHVPSRAAYLRRVRGSAALLASHPDVGGGP